jgi:hypothetical protein
MFRGMTAHSSKMLVTIYKNARRHISHVSNLQIHRSESLMFTIALSWRALLLWPAQLSEHWSLGSLRYLLQGSSHPAHSINNFINSNFIDKVLFFHYDRCLFSNILRMYILRDKLGQVSHILISVQDISFGRSRPTPPHPPHHTFLLHETLSLERGSEVYPYRSVVGGDGMTLTGQKNSPEI